MSTTRVSNALALTPTANVSQDQVTLHHTTQTTIKTDMEIQQSQLSPVPDNQLASLTTTKIAMTPTR